ncbi:response regulator transcription factor [Mariniplasma anaerobium]|uniref:Heme response regulator HssR n=1 Tax=Mariniplasma anaerobium TaxID=2735436 RepID=A0A7U9XV16_9MOLU|nr:response regulator transcription factor [Mariniplasma anaerobium]BCR35245.1 DNA-binding response regulator [Mariniplasma anaerobium]
MIKILIVDDEYNIRKLFTKYLTNQGYKAIEAEDGQKAIQIFENEHIDLLITDVMMPLMDGITLTHKIRTSYPELPILMLTALDSFEDKEKGFISGVDDYMVKPVDLNEMLLRIKALLRRYQILSSNKIELKNFILDNQSGECILNGKPIELTRKEFSLLFKLLASPNKIFTREQLMNEIWGYDSESYDRTIDTHVKRLREHITTDEYEIITVRGLGYKAVLT